MSSVVAGLIFEFCNLIMPIPFLADLNRFLVTCTHARQNLDEAGGEKTRGQLFQSGSRYLKIWYLGLTYDISHTKTMMKTTY